MGFSCVNLLFLHKAEEIRIANFNEVLFLAIAERDEIATLITVLCIAELKDIVDESCSE